MVCEEVLCLGVGFWFFIRVIHVKFNSFFSTFGFSDLIIVFFSVSVYSVFAKGQCDFGFYKFLVKTGGYRWISTQATVITEPNSNQPQSIVLVNRIVRYVSAFGGAGLFNFFARFRY